MFTLKSIAEQEAMTSEELQVYKNAEKAHEKAQILAEAKAEATAEIKTQKARIDELEGQITDLNKSGSTIENELFKSLIENKDELQRIAKAGSGAVEFTLKAPETITTQSGTFPAPPKPVGTDLAPLTNINLREIGIIPFTTNLNTSTSTYAYTETVPKDGNYEFVAEGGIKPQIDFTWATKYAQPKKIAAWMKLTMESVQDIVGLESIARDFLQKKHNLKKSKAILFGTGLLEEPTGATTYGRLFSAGALALSVQNPNFMDVINAVITDISTTHNYEDEVPYMANFVAINPVDFFINLVSAKDGDGKPLYPTATLFNMVQIGGVTIWADESIPTGKIFVADMSKYNTTNYMGYNVKVGWINDDFIKNQFVILGESRFHAFVKKLDEQAFVYDDIETIKTAITKP
jgi:HK97 family phage major capsid protein